MTPIRDVDIRRSLDAELRERHDNDPATLILHELGLCQGTARVDMAIVNGSLHGYEIKSEADTLDRLPAQRRIYCRSLDFVTIVTSKKHASAIKKGVPRWWGIWAAEPTDGGLVFCAVREARQNPKIDPFSVVELLWKEEAIEELRRLGLATGLRSKSRRVIWGVLAEELSLDELRAAVRTRLKLRGDRWRTAPVPRA